MLWCDTYYSWQAYLHHDVDGNAAHEVRHIIRKVEKANEETSPQKGKGKGEQYLNLTSEASKLQGDQDAREGRKTPVMSKHDKKRLTEKGKAEDKDDKKKAKKKGKGGDEKAEAKGKKKPDDKKTGTDGKKTDDKKKTGSKGKKKALPKEVNTKAVAKVKAAARANCEKLKKTGKYKNPEQKKSCKDILAGKGPIGNMKVGGNATKTEAKKAKKAKNPNAGIKRSDMAGASISDMKSASKACMKAAKKNKDPKKAASQKKACKDIGTKVSEMASSMKECMGAKLDDAKNLCYAA